MTAAQGAAAYFAENPTLDAVLATSDGNVWPPADLNKAQFHAAQQLLASPALFERDDEGMPALIDVAELVITARGARVDASRGTAQETPDPVMPERPTYEEARATLATALGIAELTALDESYTESGVTLTKVDAVVATFYRSGQTVDAWALQDKVVREAAVAAQFPDFITLN